MPKVKMAADMMLGPEMKPGTLPQVASCNRVIPDGLQFAIFI
jgi:hypothetical protein